MHRLQPKALNIKQMFRFFKFRKTQHKANQKVLNRCERTRNPIGWGNQEYRGMGVGDLPGEDHGGDDCERILETE